MATVGVDKRNVNSVSSEAKPELHLHFLPRGQRQMSQRTRAEMARASTTGRRAVRGSARRVDRERRAALDRQGARLLPGQPVLGRQRVHAHLRRLPAARRPHGRPARSSPALHRRPDPLRGRLACRRPRPERRLADRRACRPGPRRRAAVPRRPLARHRDLRRGRRAQQGARRLGRGRRFRRRRGRAARRHADPVGRLGVGAVRQRADRPRRRVPRPAPAAREQERGRAPLRHRRRRQRHRGPLAARLLAGQRQLRGLGLDRDPRPARDLDRASSSRSC